MVGGGEGEERYAGGDLREEVGDGKRNGVGMVKLLTRMGFEIDRASMSQKKEDRED